MTSLLADACQSAYSACQHGCHNVYASVIKPTGNAMQTISTGFGDAGLWVAEEFRKVTEEHLPKPIALLVQKIFTSIPFAVIYFFLPLEARLCIWAAYEVFRWRSQIVDEALGMAMAAESIRALVWFVGAKHMVDLVACVVTIFSSAAYFYRSTK